MKKKSSAVNVVIFIILALTSFIFIIPFLWTFITSVKTDAEIYSSTVIILPSVVTFDNYINVLTKMKNFLLFFRNSVVSSFWSVLMTVILSASMGYAFGKLEFVGKKYFMGFILLILTLPYVIYLIPIYLMQSQFDLNNTITGLVLPYIATNLPMAVFIMRGQYSNVPKELCEAAKIDGCGEWKVFEKVVLPCVRPGIATVIIFTFINVWGEFTYARTLTSTTASQTLPIGITLLRDEAASWQYGTLTATITMSLVPLLAIFLSMQKYFIKGIMDGALKG